MDKPTPTEHDVHELIRKRWSPRAFSSRPVGDSELRSLLEAARWAASCFNEQRWRFIVALRERELVNDSEGRSASSSSPAKWGRTAEMKGSIERNENAGLFASAAESRSSPQAETR